ncbi:MAG: helix-turn-helix transcriptional regulator [Firmicutes bacterium]|nr:helix-turn-helix transcriptional regulator [Bacillota bacterium]
MVRQPLQKDNPADVVALLRRLPSAFPDMLIELMKWRGYTVERLAEYALTSSSTIKRLRNDPDYESSLETIVGLCVGLRLPPVIYPDFIHRAGHSFKINNRHTAYQQLLPMAYSFGWDIFQFNEQLAEWGIASIGQDE